MSETRQIQLQYPATCRACGASLAIGVRAAWEPTERTVTCLQCEAGTPSPHAPRIYEARGPTPARRSRRRASVPRDIVNPLKGIALLVVIYFAFKFGWLQAVAELFVSYLTSGLGSD